MKPFKCTKCESSFSNEQSLKQHVLSIHGKLKQNEPTAKTIPLEQDKKAKVEQSDA